MHYSKLRDPTVQLACQTVGQTDLFVMHQAGDRYSIACMPNGSETDLVGLDQIFISSSRWQTDLSECDSGISLQSVQADELQTIASWINQHLDKFTKCLRNVQSDELQMKHHKQAMELQIISDMKSRCRQSKNGYS